ncbi:hypothetical protein [Lacisediminihabitans changchengi]|uniref:Uncharacterized protein n=1 Tax=Lacisediminihabitans changchengi TaxID=2787634 RepID=A0A934W362_9MICO|nr:hypothetical protein [Lacisediminihabitans changchengi]MBK4347581.1 hypothetical protein [Lacisediminihabitans changchengi]
MAFWNRNITGDLSLPKSDRGSGNFGDYRYNLVPSNGRVTIRLANSNPRQEELVAALESGGELETALSRRSAAEEAKDAPIEVRLFTGSRVSGVVGVVPRGLEGVIDDTLGRLEDAGRKPRIPAKVVKTRNGYRVDLLLGQTR